MSKWYQNKESSSHSYADNFPYFDVKVLHVYLNTCYNSIKWSLTMIWVRARKKQQNYMHPVKTQISLSIHTNWSESWLCTLMIAKHPRLLHADSQDSDKTGHMTRLIWAFAGCIGYLSHVMRKHVLAICEQQRCRSACASAQSDQHLWCSLLW